MKNIALFAADLHLADRTWARFPAMCGDSYFALQQLLIYAENYDVPLVLAGDLFDKAVMGAGPPVQFAKLLRDRRVNTPVYVIEGNHEWSDPNKWYDISGRALPLEPLSPVRLPSGVTLVGMDYRRAGQVAPRIAELAAKVADEPPERVVLVAHQHWRDICEIGTPDAAFSDVRGFRVMVTGDYHVSGLWAGTNGDGLPFLAVSPGSTCMQATNEPAAKFAMMLVEDAAGVLSFVALPLRTRPFYPLTISDESHVQGVVDFLRQLGPDLSLPESVQVPFVHLTCIVPLGSAMHDLRQAAKHLHFEVVHRTEATAAPVQAVSRENVRSSMLSALRGLSPSDEVYVDAVALWQATDATLRSAITQIIEREVSFATTRT